MTIFFTTLLNGAVTNLGFLATTSTGAVLLILIGITDIKMIDKIIIQDFFPVKYFLKKSLIIKSLKKEL